MATVTKQYIIDQFNRIVRTNAPRIDNAVWYRGNTPRPVVATNPFSIPNVFGARAEVVHDVGDIRGQLLASTIFNVLHAFAMELTRVRKVRCIYFSTNDGVVTITNDGKNIAALQSELALYFHIPGGQRQPGTLVVQSELNDFLRDLRDKVVSIRNDEGVYMYNVVSCHTSCHSSCHSSRSRR